MPWGHLISNPTLPIIIFRLKEFIKEQLIYIPNPSRAPTPTPTPPQAQPITPPTPSSDPGAILAGLL